MSKTLVIVRKPENETQAESVAQQLAVAGVVAEAAAEFWQAGRDRFSGPGPDAASFAQAFESRGAAPLAIAARGKGAALPDFGAAETAVVVADEKMSGELVRSFTRALSGLEGPGHAVVLESTAESWDKFAARGESVKAAGVFRPA